MTKKVIDLSQFNPVDDWEKVKKAVDAVILRLGYRGATTGTITYDPKYQEYMAACQKLGIPTMIYFFPCSISMAEAEAEANFILAAAKKVKLCGPIWLDSEVVFRDKSGRSDKLGKADRTKYLNVILRRLHAAGYACGVYASKSWFEGNLNDDDLETYCLRWVAQWAEQLTYSGHDVALWQYTNNGAVSGISGRVDISHCYIALDDSKGTQGVSSGVSRQDIVEQICSWEGWNEKNEKHRIIIDIYNKYLPTAVKTGTLNYKVKYIDEWCATGASAAYIQAGAPELFPIECGCPRNIELARKMGIWEEADNHIPKPAEAVLYDWQDSGSGDNAGTADHIGLVIDVDAEAGTFTVMECNKDEAVGRRVMQINGRYIRGFICPKFSDDTGNTIKATTPKTASGADTKTAGGYEVSGTGTPSKKELYKGVLINGMKVTARRQPKVSGTPCSFSPVKSLAQIIICDYITTDKRWAYCCVNGLYGYILASSIRDYVRTGGKNTDKVAEWVINDDFSTGEARRKALEYLRYDYDAVQKIVTERIRAKTAADSADNPRIRIWAIPPFFEGNQGERLFGDSTAIIQYDASGKPQHVVLIDAGLVKDNGSLKPPIVKKLKGAGITKIDALVLSHAHGDHFGMFSDIFKNFEVKHLYLPAYDGLKALGLTSYVNAIKNQAEKAKKYGAGYSYMIQGEVFRLGQIVCECLFQANYKDLDNKDGHYAVNSLSPALRFTLGGIWRYHTAGDMQNDANRRMVKAVKDLSADVFKFQWHGDGNAINSDLMNAIRPKIAISNYHHSERSGRAGTWKKAEAVGAVVARNWENGDIYIDCQGGTMKLSCSKGNLTKVFTKTVPVQKAWTAYKVSLSTKVKPADVKAGMLLAIEPEDYTKAEVAALKAKGATALGYLSIGSISDERDSDKEMKAYALEPLPDWPHEKYLDVRKTAVREWLIRRAKEIKAKGFDGFWIDNLDVCEEYESTAMFEACKSAIAGIKALGGYVMVNGGMVYLQKAMDADGGHTGIPGVDGVTQEEVFSLITDYGDGKDKGKFGAQTSKQSDEYQSHMKRVIRHKGQAFLLEYTEDNTLKLRINAFCNTTGAMACISSDVNL